LYPQLLRLYSKYSTLNRIMPKKASENIDPSVDRMEWE